MGPEGDILPPSKTFFEKVEKSAWQSERAMVSYQSSLRETPDASGMHLVN